MSLRRPRLAAVAAAGAIALLALTGCTSGTGSAASESSSGPVTVTFWHEMSGAGATEIAALVQQFNQQHQGTITVKESFQGSYADVQTKYTAAVQSKSTPSLLSMNDISTGFMVDSGQIVPVSTFTGDDASFDADSIPASVRQYYGASAGLLSMPFSVSQPMLYLKRDLVEKAGLDPANPPTTLEGVADWAERIHAATGAYGMSMNMGDSWILEELTASGGEDFCTPDNGRGSKPVSGISMTSPNQVAFLTRLQKLFTDGSALNPGTDSAAMSSAFTSDKVGMLLTSSASYTTLDPAKDDSVVVATFPTTSASSDAGEVIGGNSLWISGPGHSTAEQKASYEFAAFLQTAESQAAWAAATGYLAINDKAATTDTGTTSLQDPNVARMYQQLSQNPASTATAGCRTGAFPTVRATVISAFNKIIEGGDVATEMGAAEKTAKQQIAAYNEAAGH